RAAYLLVSAAQRGGAARDWASTLVRMYRRWAAHRGYGIELLGERLSLGAEGRAAVLRIDGPNAFGLLQGETGTHRRIAGNPKTGAREVTSARILVLPDPARAEGRIEPDYRTQKADELWFLEESCGVVTIEALGKEWRIHTPLPRREAIELGRDLARALLECRASLGSSLGRIVRNVGLSKRRYAKDPRTGHQATDVAAVLDGKIDDFILAALLELRSGAEEASADGPASGDKAGRGAKRSG
ncbi:MAG: hypothetical protein CME06_09160, partial [Gemmatimonadetes bacterium]|nr:hypothetical protein [Gemmatimonadota bacterium]